MFFILSLLMFLPVNAENLSTRTFYSNFLFAEKAPAANHLNFEGFIDNTLKHIKDKKDVASLIGSIHNVMLETFYSCTATSPKAKSFSEAVDGKHTPDSQHYASLIHSALSLRGIKTDFLKTPTHYGLHYVDEITGEELFWCIITPLSMKPPTTSKKEYIAIFNKYKNPEINGRRNIKESDVKIITVDEFAQINMPPKKMVLD